MRIDNIIGNPPYGSTTTCKIPHLYIMETLLPIFTSTMNLIMPGSVIKSVTESSNIESIRKKMNKNLTTATELPKDTFPTTDMPATFIYTFHRNKPNNNILIQFLDGSERIVSDISKTHDVLLDNIDKKILSYLSYTKNGKYGLQYIFTNFATNHFKGLITNKNIDEYRKKLKTLFLKDKDMHHTIDDFEKAFILILARADNKQRAKPICGNAGGIIKANEYIKVFENSNLDRNYYAEKNAIIISPKESSNPEISALNLKNAFQRPLLRFYFTKVINNQHLAIKHYNYIPNIDWTDERTKTDSGILEMCGCPKEKIDEYLDKVNKDVEKYDNIISKI